MAFGVMCMKYFASRDIYLIIKTDATSLPCLFSTSPIDKLNKQKCPPLALSYPIYSN